MFRFEISGFLLYILRKLPLEQIAEGQGYGRAQDAGLKTETTFSEGSETRMSPAENRIENEVYVMMQDARKASVVQ